MTPLKTGPKPRFASQDVVTAALELDLAELTMAKVASRLGMATSAIYRVVQSREQLLAACADHALTASGLANIDAATWQDFLRTYVDTIWGMFDNYPGLAQVILLNPAVQRRSNDAFDQLADRLAAFGVTRPQAAFALDFLGDITINTHMGVVAYRRLDDAAAAESAAEGAMFSFRPEYRDRGNLPDKVEFIIAGLEREWPGL
ncbi:TetR/AcrR family transcriptional regulator [Corynebacterium uterequi]|uniref:Transcriptional regulator, TetR family n=1 Tax=Corynebacterium uterequi TaxID=1072256 RepID=A0A0G3HFT7_9CORY|nr:hypothetical protein [Corynebacterium uterequi]AKK12149.1 transcriptional regulator, TetR family [Corynebacterium uterequi]